MTRSQLSGNTIKCPACGQHNQSLALYCQRCGVTLRPSQTSGQVSYVPDFVRNTRQPALDETWPSLTNESEVETQDMAVYQSRYNQKGTSVFDTNSFLRIQIVGSRAPLIFRVQQENALVFGRGNPAEGQVQIDLTAYKAQINGVSRRHAAIDRRGKKLFLWDLESSNGTYLNGARLEPYQRYQLQDGDEICLGQLTFHLFFQNVPAR